jgi:hypothetical protein
VWAAVILRVSAPPILPQSSLVQTTSLDPAGQNKQTNCHIRILYEYTASRPSTMPSPISPLNSYKPPAPASPLSTKTFHIAGILTTVFGLAEIPPDASEVVCIWLLHPRQDSQKDMVGLATTIVHDYYDIIKTSATNSKQRGFIAVAFDARNHGTREIHPIANEAWRSGNENHAPDMFSIYCKSM